MAFTDGHLAFLMPVVSVMSPGPHFDGFSPWLQLKQTNPLRAFINDASKIPHNTIRCLISERIFKEIMKFSYLEVYFLVFL